MFSHLSNSDMWQRSNRGTGWTVNGKHTQAQADFLAETSDPEVWNTKFDFGDKMRKSWEMVKDS